MNTIVCFTFIVMFLLLILSMNKLGKLSKKKELIVHKNVNNDGKIFVQDAIFDTQKKRFTSLTSNFHDKVIAWMPMPEPFKPNK